VVSREEYPLVSGLERDSRSVSFAALVTYELTAMLVKVFATIVIWLRFDRTPNWPDMATIFAYDSLLTLFGIALIASFYGTWRWFRNTTIVRGAITRVDVLNWIVSRATPFVVELSLCVCVTYAIIVYILNGWVVWEWGAFLEPHHYETIQMSNVGSTIFFFLKQPRVLVPVAFVALLVATFRFLHFKLKNYRLLQRATIVVSLFFALTALIPMAAGRSIDPSMASPVIGYFGRPIIMRFFNVDGLMVTDGLPESFPQPSLDGFEPVSPVRPVPEAYAALPGVARDMDVVLIILESVRQSNVSVYDYRRDTSPTLRQLADSGLVFHNGYATQPRSTKTLFSLITGAYPDPRLSSIVWKPERIRNRDTLISVLRANDYALYAARGLEDSVDGFGPFLREAGAGAMEVINVDDLRKTCRPYTSERDDGLLIRDYLRWRDEQGDRKTFGLLWFHAAHYPYEPLYPRFEPSTETVNRYDSCVFSSDIAIRRLIEGLKRRGTDRRTLLIVMGDHGEALGEHLDMAHGRFLYEMSIKIPLIISIPGLGERIDLDQRFQIKDIPSTLLNLLGLPDQLRQSEVVYSKSAEDKVYLSNVSQDFKLGMIRDGGSKFVYRPRYDLRYLFDLSADPGEDRNQIQTLPQEEIDAMIEELYKWYFYQVRYLENELPDVNTTPSSRTEQPES